MNHLGYFNRISDIDNEQIGNSFSIAHMAGKAPREIAFKSFVQISMFIMISNAVLFILFVLCFRKDKFKTIMYIAIKIYLILSSVLVLTIYTTFLLKLAEFSIGTLFIKPSNDLYAFTQLSAILLPILNILLFGQIKLQKQVKENEK